MLVTLDFETFHDDDFTLKKLSTSEYIRDARFEALSCSIKINDRVPFCYFGKDDIQVALDKLDWRQITLLCHHTQFDGLILSHHFGKVPARYADTLSMARALHPKLQSNRLEDVALHYGKTNKLPQPDFKGKHLADLTKELRQAIYEYNNADVQACYEIYQEIEPKFPPLERDLVDITVRMFADPVLCVDMQLAQRELVEEQTRRGAAIAASGQTEKELSSNTKFVLALEGLDIDVPMKPSPTVANKMIPAVAKSDEAMQALLLHTDDRVVALVEGRLAAKSTIGESRAQRMLLRGANEMRLPIYLAYAAAHTLRWTGGDKFNPQNMKQLRKVGGKLREAITAPPGQMIVVIDSAQIEARLVAWLAEEEWVLDAFRNKRDLYSEFATKAYQRLITKDDKEERFVGKTCVLGLGYGMGGPKLQVTVLTQSISQGLDPVRLPLEVCFHLVTTYRTECQKIKELWKFMNDKGIAAMLSGVELRFKCLEFQKGKVLTPNGLALLYPGLSANVVKKGQNKFFKGETAEAIHDASYLGARSRNKIYGGLLTENLIQALARIVVANAMREIAQSYRVVMMTHDEVAFLAPQSEADTALKSGMALMCEPPHWAPDLPLSAEGGYDVCYSK
jgi:DNA polymerase